MVKQNRGVSKRRTIDFQSTEARFRDNKTYRCRSRANAVGPYVTTEAVTTVCSAGVHHSETTPFSSIIRQYKNKQIIKIYCKCKLQNVLVSIYVSVLGILQLNRLGWLFAYRRLNLSEQNIWIFPSLYSTLIQDRAHYSDIITQFAERT